MIGFHRVSGLRREECDWVVMEYAIFNGYNQLSSIKKTKKI